MFSMQTKICQKTKTPTWQGVSFSVDPQVWQQFRVKAKEMGRSNLSGLVESLMFCYCHETCVDCPEFDTGDVDRAKTICKAGILRMTVEDKT
jgi:hypothetical protein